MGQSINEAVKLMLTGMSTVFLILVIVVILGNLIILLTNKFSVKIVSQPEQKNDKQTIDPQKLAVIISAVETVTGGKGQVTSIQKSE